MAKKTVAEKARARREKSRLIAQNQICNVSADDWADIVACAVKHAKNNDRHSRQWLTDYNLGKPEPLVAAADGNVLHVTFRAATPADAEILEDSD